MSKNPSAAFATVLLFAANAFASASPVASSEKMLTAAIGGTESCIERFPASGDSDKLTQVLKDRGDCLAQANESEAPASPTSPSSSGATASSPSKFSFAAPSDIEKSPLIKIKKKMKSDSDSPGPKRSFGLGNLMNALPIAITAALIATLVTGPVGIAIVAGVALVAGYALSASIKIDYSS